MTGTIETMKIIKRNGEIEPFSELKLRRVIEWACDNNKGLADMMWDEFMKTLPEKLRTETLVRQLTRIAYKNISLIYPEFQDVAGRLFILDMYKTSYNLQIIDGNVTYPSIKSVWEYGIKHNLIIDMGYSDDEMSEMDSWVDHKRDFKPYRSVFIFADKYQKKKSKYKYLELPQHVYMRVAAFLCMNEKHDRMECIKRMYEHLSKGHVTHGTPITLNAGTPNRMLSSCVLGAVDDNTESIMDSIEMAAKYSKHGGGIAQDWSRIRAKGSNISSNASVSSGMVPFLKILQEVLCSFNQGGSRKGSACVYYPIWYKDIRELLPLRSDSGTEENRVRRLKYAVKLNREIFDAAIENRDFYLFNPIDVPDLQEWSKEKYDYYVEQGLGTPVNARELMFEVITQALETGHLYMFHEENVNEQSPLNKYIHNSNLCVHPDTKVLTRFGYRRIGDGGNHDIWNGKEWSNVEFVKTGENQEMIKILTSTGKELICTPYHKFYAVRNDIVEVKAMDLRIGETLVSNGLNGTRPVVIGIRNYGLSDSYCFNEPLRHKGVFNGILTGQCSEITLPTKPSSNHNSNLSFDINGNPTEITTRTPEEIALCNLESVNIEKYIELNSFERTEFINTIVRTLDNTIDLAKYPIAGAEVANKKYRYLGIGVSNYAYAMVKSGYKFSDQNSLEWADELFKDISTRIIRASCELAKEKGQAPGFKETCWPEWLKDRDYDPDLISDVKHYGLRNCSLMAIAPTATSTKPINATDSCEPILNFQWREDLMVSTPCVAPGFKKYNSLYEKAFEIDPKVLIDHAAIRQKYIDQSMSTILYFSDPSSFKKMFDYFDCAFQEGLKTIYYTKTQKDIDTEICESCS